MLSERDSRLLAEIERGLIRDDPGLERVLRKDSSQARRLRSFQLLALGVFALLVAVVLDAGQFLFLFGLAITVYAVVRLMRHAEQEASGSAREG